MSQPLYEYKTRYTLTVNYLTNDYEIEPIDTINTGTATDKEVKDSISSGNIQVVHKWPRYTFEINLPGMAKNLAIFYWAQNYNKDLIINITEEMDATEDTSSIRLRNIHLEKAFITDIRETILSNDVPGIRITGVATYRSTKIDTVEQPMAYQRGVAAATPPTNENSAQS